MHVNASLTSFVFRVSANQLANQMIAVQPSSFARIASVYKKLDATLILTVVKLKNAGRMLWGKLNVIMPVMDLYSVDVMLSVLPAIMKQFVLVRLVTMAIPLMTKLDAGPSNVKVMIIVPMINSVKITCVRLPAWLKTLVESMLSAQHKIITR